MVRGTLVVADTSTKRGGSLWEGRGCGQRRTADQAAKEGVLVIRVRVRVTVGVVMWLNLYPRHFRPVGQDLDGD